MRCLWTLPPAHMPRQAQQRLIATAQRMATREEDEGPLWVAPPEPSSSDEDEDGTGQQEQEEEEEGPGLGLEAEAALAPPPRPSRADKVG